MYKLQQEKSYYSVILELGYCVIKQGTILLQKNIVHSPELRNKHVQIPKLLSTLTPFCEEKSVLRQLILITILAFR